MSGLRPLSGDDGPGRSAEAGRGPLEASGGQGEAPVLPETENTIRRESQPGNLLGQLEYVLLHVLHGGNIQIDARVHGRLFSQPESDDLGGLLPLSGGRPFSQVCDAQTATTCPQRTLTAASSVRNM